MAFFTQFFQVKKAMTKERQEQGNRSKKTTFSPQSDVTCKLPMNYLQNNRKCSSANTNITNYKQEEEA